MQASVVLRQLPHPPQDCGPQKYGTCLFTFMYNKVTSAYGQRVTKCWSICITNGSTCIIGFWQLSSSIYVSFDPIHGDKDWAAVHEQLEVINLKYFMFIKNGVVDVEILDVDDVIENHAQMTKMGQSRWIRWLITFHMAGTTHTTKSDKTFISGSSDKMSVGVNSYLFHMENVIIHCVYHVQGKQL